jgi:hypothetical protein
MNISVKLSFFAEKKRGALWHLCQDCEHLLVLSKFVRTNIRPAGLMPDLFGGGFLMLAPFCQLPFRQYFLVIGF